MYSCQITNVKEELYKVNCNKVTGHLETCNYKETENNQDKTSTVTPSSEVTDEVPDFQGLSLLCKNREF